MTRPAHGLIIGKFYPPHRGHHEVIRAAAGRCDRLTVLVMAAAAESIPLTDRVDWLRAEHADDPRIRVIGVCCDAPLDLGDRAVWAAQVAVMQATLRVDPIAAAAGPVDLVVGGDDYVTQLAGWFDAASLVLPRPGWSGTAVRADLAGCWNLLAPATRVGLVTTVVIVGAESTGTTSVARALAEHYATRGGGWATTRWVPEYGREYTEAKWAAERVHRPGLTLDEMVWDASDFDAVAVEQTRREELAARTGSPLLVCDTDAFATAIWERRYLAAAARADQPWTRVPPRAVYLVTDHVGVPWEDDGLREGDLAVRAAMTGWFTDALTTAGQSWVLLTGSLADKVRLAVRTVDGLLERRTRFAAPLSGPGFPATVPESGRRAANASHASVPAPVGAS
jgi:NadR type nicotinamide-nucleotide adenylyltransferase